MEIPTTPRGSGDIWTLDPKKKAWAAHSQEQLAREPPLGEACPAQLSPARALYSLPPPPPGHTGWTRDPRDSPGHVCSLAEVSLVILGLPQLWAAAPALLHSVR